MGGTVVADYLNSKRLEESRKQKTAEMLKMMDSVIQVGKPLPDNIFETATGDSVALSSVVRGTTLLSFVVPSCQFCTKQINDLRNNVSLDQTGKDIVLISEFTPEEFPNPQYMHSAYSTFLFDRGGLYQQNLSIFAYPFNLVVDEELLVISIIPGLIDEEMFERVMTNRL